MTATENGPAVNVPILSGQQTAVSFTGTAGDEISMQVVEQNLGFFSGTFPSVTIQDPSGNTVSGPTTIPGLVGPLTLPATGTYKVVFNSAGDTALLSMNLYQFTDQRSSITVNGPSVTATISAPGQRSFFSFNGTAGENVGVTFGPTTFGDLPPSAVSIQDASGNSISGSNYNFTLPATGAYNVVIGAGSGTGSASLKLSSPPVQTPPGTIIANGPLVDLTLPTFTSTASVTFAGTAGEQVSLGTGLVDVTGIGSGQATVAIKDASGAVLPGGSANLFTVLGPVMLPSDGTYTIEVDANNEGSGTVAVHLTTPEPGSAASATRAAPAARATPVKPADCGKSSKLSNTKQKGQTVYHYGRDAWCAAPRVQPKP